MLKDIEMILHVTYFARSSQLSYITFPSCTYGTKFRRVSSRLLPKRQFVRPAKHRTGPNRLLCVQDLALLGEDLAVSFKLFFNSAWDGEIMDTPSRNLVDFSS